MSRDKTTIIETVDDDQWTTIVPALSADTNTAQRGARSRQFTGLQVHNRSVGNINVNLRTNDGSTQVVIRDSGSITLKPKETLVLTEHEGDKIDLDADTRLEMKFDEIPSTAAAYLATYRDV